MKKHNHPVDDFFRNALSDYQAAPSDAARKAFLENALQVTRTRKRVRAGLIFLSALIALAGMGIIFWFTMEEGSPVSSREETKPPVEHAMPAVTRIKDSPEKTTSYDQKITGNKTSNLQQRNIGAGNLLPKPAPATPAVAHKTRPLNSHAGIKNINSPESTYVLKNNPSTKPIAGSKVSSENFLPLPQTPDSTIVANNTPSTNPATTPENVPAGNPAEANQVPVPGMKKTDSVVKHGEGTRGTGSDNYKGSSNVKPAIGVYFTPEWMFNTIEGTKFVSNFGVEGTIHFGRFSIRTGAGLSIARGTNELDVAYNEFLGSYNKLDSLQLIWNNPEKKYVPKYFLTRENVWDSLMTLESARVVKRYTYLQVPLVMGYDFWQTDVISMGVRIGPVMSVLLASKQLSAAYDPGSKRIISINDISPGQVSLNWQAMAGLSISVRLAKGLHIEVEPSARYYFNSVYEKPVPSSKPWSVGIRAALMMEL